MIAAQTQDITYVVIILIVTAIALFFYNGFKSGKFGGRPAYDKSEQNKRRDIIKATINTQEQERNRIAINLHDSVGAELSMIKLNISKFVFELNKKNVDSAALEKQLQQLDHAIDQIRAICRDLYPVALQSYGFIKTFEELIGKINEANVIVCKYKFNMKEEDFFSDHESKLSLLRIFQELVNNLIKYANCTALDIGFMKYEESIKIILKHNGVPFDNASVTEMIKIGRGVGLSSISNRINLLKGKIDYLQVNNGSEIIIEIPKNYGG